MTIFDQPDRHLIFSDDIDGNIFAVTDKDGIHIIRIATYVNIKEHIETLFPTYTNLRLANGDEMVKWVQGMRGVEVIGSFVDGKEIRNA